MKDLLHGDLVHLTVEDPEIIARLISEWSANSEFSRLLDWDPARRISIKNAQKWVEKQAGRDTVFEFAIRTLDGDRIIGEVGLDGIRWTHRHCYVGIGLGDPEFWGKGYGTDAMRIILRYAFSELNMERVSLDVFEYNQRGVRSYEKAGFVIEGRKIGLILREGRRWDVIYMGILREDWLKMEKQRMEKTP